MLCSVKAYIHLIKFLICNNIIISLGSFLSIIPPGILNTEGGISSIE